MLSRQDGERPVVRGRSAFHGVAEEMIARRREKQVLDALDDLSKYLRGLRDERKAVITITGGWVLFRENPEPDAKRPQPIRCRPGITPQGKLSTDREATEIGFSRRECERDRMNLAMLNNWQTFRDLMEDANRANVSFYPVNALGLVALDKPINKDDIARRRGAGARCDRTPRAEHRARRPFTPIPILVASRSENLRTLAENTDGLAVVDTNDLDKGMRRVVDDLTSYYLLGYYSTNTKLDGKFRKLTVRVKRPNVDVRARHGYRAATREEIEAGKTAAATVEASAPPALVQVALNSLGSARQGVPLRTSVSYAPIGPDEGTERRVHLWALTELDPSVVRAGEWLGGGSVNVAVLSADNEVLTESTTPLPAGQRALAVDLGEVVVPERDVMVRTRVTPTQEGLPYSDTIRLSEISAPGRPIVLRRGPTTGIKFVPTADLQFRRTERVRLELPTMARGDRDERGSPRPRGEAHAADRDRHHAHGGGNHVGLGRAQSRAAGGGRLRVEAEGGVCRENRGSGDGLSVGAIDKADTSRGAWRCAPVGFARCSLPHVGRTFRSAYEPPVVKVSVQGFMGEPSVPRIPSFRCTSTIRNRSSPGSNVISITRAPGLYPTRATTGGGSGSPRSRDCVIE